MKHLSRMAVGIALATAGCGDTPNTKQRLADVNYVSIPHEPAQGKAPLAQKNSNNYLIIENFRNPKSTCSTHHPLIGFSEKIKSIKITQEEISLSIDLITPLGTEKSLFTDKDRDGNPEIYTSPNGYTFSFQKYEQFIQEHPDAEIPESIHKRYHSLKKYYASEVSYLLKYCR